MELFARRWFLTALGDGGSRSEQIKPLMFVCHCRADIDQGEQHKNKSL